MDASGRALQGSSVRPSGPRDRAGAARRSRSTTSRSFTAGITHARPVQLGLAGGFDEATPGLVGRPASASLPPSRLDIPPLPAPRMPRGLEVTIVEKPADATAISMGFPIDVTRRDDDFYALAVANSYLGEHRTFNGKLMQDLRGKRGLNYGDYSYIEDFIQDGPSTFPIPNNPRRQAYFSIWIRPGAARQVGLCSAGGALGAGPARRATECPRKISRPTRTFLLNYSKLWVQTLSRRLGYAIDGEFYGRKDLVTELADRLPKLTVDQVNAAIRKHLENRRHQGRDRRQGRGAASRTLDLGQTDPHQL